MKDKILDSLIEKKPLVMTDEEAKEILYDICETEHAGCNPACPVYDEVLTQTQKDESDCPYFKNGEKMLVALRKARGIR